MEVQRTKTAVLFIVNEPNPDKQGEYRRKKVSEREKEEVYHFLFGKPKIDEVTKLVKKKKVEEIRFKGFTPEFESSLTGDLQKKISNKTISSSPDRWVIAEKKKENDKQDLEKEEAVA